MDKIKAIESYENICFCCLKEKTIETFNLYRNEYGSSFDNNHTQLQLCSECKPDGLEEWFNESPEMNDGYCADYKLEGKIINFINTLPLQGQELFWCRCSSGANATYMSSQDWIDDKLCILPDEVYEEEYGMYSPRQKNAYKERFPTCEHPVNAVFDDQSKGCYCPFGARGEYGQEAEGWNISTECFNCNHYKVREIPIKEMTYDTYKKYELYIQGMQYKDLFESK